MPTNRTTLRITLCAASALAVALPAAAQAQTVLRAPAQIGATQVDSLPPAPMPTIGGTQATQYPQVPITTAPGFTEERTIGPDGVETITRTRIIHRAAPIQQGGHPTMGYPVAHAAPAVYNQEQWLAECRRRIKGLDRDERASVLGGLLGAVAGGVIGNRVGGNGNRLAGTLIGAGAGGLAGTAIGSAIDSGNANRAAADECESTLDQYMSHGGAVRSIPQGYPMGHAYPQGYGHAGCGCQQQQVTFIPVQTTQRQRVIVRERITEQLVPGDRIIPPAPLPPRPLPRPLPSPKLIKQ